MRVNELPKLSRVNCTWLLDGKNHTKLANNTTLRSEGQTNIVRLHETDILTLHPNGNITVNTNGWNTRTTISRLDTMLAGYACRQVNAKAGKCVITMLDGTTRTGNRTTIKAEDYMT